MSIITDIVTLMEKGFVHYTVPVPESFYISAKCPNPKKAEWFTRPWSEHHRHSRYVCIGCNRRCTAVNPIGWQLLIPVGKYKPDTVAFAPIAQLTAQELLNNRLALRVEQAAWILNLSRTKVYELIQEGILATVQPSSPVRVTSASVRKLLEQE